MSPEQTHILKNIVAEIEPRFRGECTGHDWYHVDRVRRMALRIAAHEGGDPYVIELAALTHDIGDAKFNGGDETAAPREVSVLLSRHGVVSGVLEHVVAIIANMSFKGGSRPPMATLEGKIVQDADRLDAIGAIGVARAFAYGGHKGRVLHDPDVSPQLNMSVVAYRNNKGPTTNHFHEKLFLLKELMNTATARELAAHRHAFLGTFLDEFVAEFDGKR